jgi:hypothetical protein
MASLSACFSNYAEALLLLTAKAPASFSLALPGGFNTGCHTPACTLPARCLTYRCLLVLFNVFPLFCLRLRQMIYDSALSVKRPENAVYSII